MRHPHFFSSASPPLQHLIRQLHKQRSASWSANPAHLSPLPPSLLLSRCTYSFLERLRDNLEIPHMPAAQRRANAPTTAPTTPTNKCVPNLWQLCYCPTPAPHHADVVRELADCIIGSVGESFSLLVLKLAIFVWPSLTGWLLNYSVNKGALDGLADVHLASTWPPMQCARVAKV